MQIAILDLHPIEDSRIIRHIDYLNKLNLKIIRINIDKYQRLNHLVETNTHKLTLYQVGCSYSHSNKIDMILFIINRLFINFDIYISLNKKMNNMYSVPTIFHVHDPILLPLVIKLSSLFRTKWIVYDRHEVFESRKNFYSYIYLPKIARIAEILTSTQIDGVVTVLEEYRNVVQEYFPHSQIAVVPNLPVLEDYDDTAIQSKIEKITPSTTIQFVYFGSLFWNRDRDIGLILDIAEHLLSKHYNVRFIVGGKTSDEKLLSEFARLNQAYPNNFIYAGYLPRQKVIEYTQDAHFGFFLMRPDSDYWVKCSPNKVFEYLRCGVIPVLRADVAFKEEFDNRSLWFERDDSREYIINTIESILSDTKRIQEMMQHAFQLSAQYSFNSVADEYLALYEAIGAIKPYTNDQ